MSDPHNPPSLPFTQPVRRSTLAARKPTRFALEPDAKARERIADWLGLVSLSLLSFRGEIRPVGRADFTLVARLEADLEQPSVVTLAPVPAHIGEEVRRTFLSDWHEPEGDESEMPDDDTLEPLGDVIDLGAVMVEALSLALPPYPRAPGDQEDDPVVARATAPNAEPLTDDKLRPFAGLSKLLKDAEGKD